MENKQRTKKKNYLDILIQNFDDSGHNYNELIQKGDPQDDVSDCNSWQQVAMKNEGSEPDHTF